MSDVGIQKFTRSQKWGSKLEWTFACNAMSPIIPTNFSTTDVTFTFDGPAVYGQAGSRAVYQWRPLGVSDAAFTLNGDGSLGFFLTSTLASALLYPGSWACGIGIGPTSTTQFLMIAAFDVYGAANGKYPVAG